ncbi:hypothetical protein [Shewanella sp.]|uniref:hypothetical protein n=1 Tax=Shewanella sp. TaxID=50422 RepID=UPI0040538B50
MTNIALKNRNQIIVNLINEFGEFAEFIYLGKDITPEDLPFINSMKALVGLTDDSAVAIAISEFKAEYQGLIGNKEESSLMLIEGVIAKQKNEI